MPESKPRKRAARPTEAATTQQYKPNPIWYKPVMFGLMIIGLLWIITFYITAASFPYLHGRPGTSWRASASRSSASS